jgi:cytochrome P450
MDASLAMTRLTLDITWQMLFGAGTHADAPPIVARAAPEIHAAQIRGEVNVPAAKMAELADEAARRVSTSGLVSPNPFHAWGAISERAPKDDLSRQELYDNARAFLIAGHETTTLTLTWALWLVAQDVEAQRRIHDEIDQVVGAEPIEDAHIERLAFTGQVLNETMRLFSPALVTVRQSKDRIVLCGETLPAGTVLVVCIYALHRHRVWWKEPDLFRPDRFTSDSGEPRHRYAYLPFGIGQHACIGAAVGWKEVVTIFAAILQKFRVSTDDKAVRPRVALTLRPDREVPIAFHLRR